MRLKMFIVLYHAHQQRNVQAQKAGSTQSRFNYICNLHLTNNIHIIIFLTSLTYLPNVNQVIFLLYSTEYYNYDGIFLVANRNIHDSVTLSTTITRCLPPQHSLVVISIIPILFKVLCARDQRWDNVSWAPRTSI